MVAACLVLLEDFCFSLPMAKLQQRLHKKLKNSIYFIRHEYFIKPENKTQGVVTFSALKSFSPSLQVSLAVAQVFHRSRRLRCCWALKAELDTQVFVCELVQRSL